MAIERVDRNQEIYLMCSTKLYVNVSSSPAKAAPTVPTFLAMRSTTTLYTKDIWSLAEAERNAFPPSSTMSDK